MKMPSKEKVIIGSLIVLILLLGYLLDRRVVILEKRVDLMDKYGTRFHEELLKGLPK